jgi:hypothetical protein
MVVSLFVEPHVADRAGCSARFRVRLAPDHLRRKDDNDGKKYTDQPRHRSVRWSATPPAYHHIRNDQCSDHTKHHPWKKPHETVKFTERVVGATVLSDQHVEPVRGMSKSNRQHPDRRDQYAEAEKDEFPEFQRGS